MLPPTLDVAVDLSALLRALTITNGAVRLPPADLPPDGPFADDLRALVGALSGTPTWTLWQAAVVEATDGSAIDVKGTTAFLGAGGTVDLSLKADGSLTCRATQTDARLGAIGFGLRWTRLVVDVARSADGAWTGTLTGELTDGTGTPTAVRGTLGDGAWALDAAAWTPGGLTPTADLLAGGPDLARLLGSLSDASVTGAPTVLAIVPVLGTWRLEATWPLVETWDVWPGMVSFTTATITPSADLGRDPSVFALYGFGLRVAGDVTVDSGSFATTLEGRFVRGAPQLTVALANESTPPWTMASLLGLFPGDADPLDALPAGLADRVGGSGFDAVRVSIGPGSAFEFHGDGTFLGWRGSATLGTAQQATGRAMWFEVEVRNAPDPLPAIVEDLGLPFPDGLAALVPDVAVALRVVGIDQRFGRTVVGGELSDIRPDGSGAWRLDLRLTLGPPGMRLEVGDLYPWEDRPATHTPPTFPELLGALLPSEIERALTGLEAVAPAGLAAKLLNTTIASADLQFVEAPPDGSVGLQLAARLVGNVPGDTPTAPTRLASVAVRYRAGSTSAGGVAVPASFAIELVVPFLTLGVDDLLAAVGLGELTVGIDFELTLSSLLIDTGRSRVRVALDITVEDQPASVLVDVARGADGAWAFTLGLSLLGLRFGLRVDGTRLTATYADDGSGLTLGALADALGWDDFPDTLDLSLAEVTLALDRDPASPGAGFRATLDLDGTKLGAAVATKRFGPPPGQPPPSDGSPTGRLWGVQASMTGGALALDRLPIVGALLPDLSTFQVKILDASLGFVGPASLSGRASELAALVPAGGTTTAFPETGGLSLRVRLQILRSTTVIDTADPALGGGGPAGAPPVGGTPGSPGTPVTPVPPGGQLAKAASTDLAWVVVNQSLGPVRIAQVGAGYTDGDLLIGVTGSLQLGVVELTLIGLRVGVPLAVLSDPARLTDIRPDLDGVGLAVNASGVTLGGALIRRGDRMEGAALLGTSGITLTALASLSSTADGTPSLFLYGVLRRPIGGPSFFFVTGVAAGFGYNRGLVVPPVAGVPRFLMVRAAIGDRQVDPTTIGGLVALLADPTTATTFPVQADQYFLAAGIKFTSYKVVDSFLMAIVSFGRTTRIDVLGVSTLELPPRVGGAPSPVPPLGRIQLALKATYLVEQGRLDVAGQLVGSYILSPAAVLTGGFAVYAQFTDDPVTGAQAGDFVATVGGYHPRYRRPAHYPTAPRVGLSWRVDRNLFIKGGAYLAVTPAAAMAGGALDATWNKGILSARFRASADFWVSWKPFAYSASLVVGFRGSFKWRKVVSITISVDVSASLDLYGPPFGGVATLDLDITSFRVSFGAGRPRPRVTITEFRDSFLPAAAVDVAVVAGAIGRDGELWRVQRTGVELAVRSAVPITSLTPEGGAVLWSEEGLTVVPCTCPATTPVGLRVLYGASADGPFEDASGMFDLVGPGTKAFPKALWTDGSAGATTSMPASLRIVPKAVPPPGETAAIALADLLASQLDDTAAVALGPQVAAAPPAGADRFWDPADPVAAALWRTLPVGAADGPQTVAPAVVEDATELATLATVGGA